MKHFSLMLVMVLFTMSTALAQRTVTGTVLLEGDGEAIGATVVVEGDEGVGTVTEFDGTFSLSVPEGAEALKISYTGYTTEIASIVGVNSINVTLASGELLEEVVVVGYGSQSKDRLTGSVEEVGSEEIGEVPLASIDQILQGKASGVLSMSGSGQPGANTDIRIRGQGSFSASSSPLYVLDGVIISSGDLTANNPTANVLATINPNDIESVSILKDASAVAIYGSRGANGAIIITTKRGKAGATKFNFSTQFGFSERTPSPYRSLNSAELLDYLRDGAQNAGATIEQATTAYPDSLANVDTDWVDEAFRTGLTQSYELSASGGDEKTKFFLSGSYFNQEGVVIQTFFERLSGRMNVEHQATEKLSFGTNLGLSNTFQDSRSGGGQFRDPITGAYLFLPFDNVYNDDGSYNYDFVFNTLNSANFVGVANEGTLTARTIRINGNIFGAYDILPGLQFKQVLGIDWINVDEDDFHPKDVPGNAFLDGVKDKVITKDVTWTSQSLFNYNKLVNEKHSIGVLAGFEATDNNYNRFSASGEGYATKVLQTLNNAANPLAVGEVGSSYSFLGILSRLDYGYAGKYYGSFTFRRDGSSRFGKDNRWANFWSVGGGWRISEEKFMGELSWLDNLKVRASYGTSGNASIGNFAARNLYGYGVSYNGASGSSPTNPGNPALKWESMKTADVGLEFGFLKRVSGSVDFYRRVNDGLLYDVPVSRTSGYNDFLENLGAVENKGIELDLSVDIFNKEFKWSVGGNISFNRNKVITLSDNDGDGEGDQVIDGFFVREEGEAWNTFFLEEWAGVNPANGQPLWYDEAGNITDSYNDAARVKVGGADPKFFGGFDTDISYKGISISADFFYTYGSKLYDQTRRIIESDGAFFGFNQSANQLDAWQNPGDITNTPQIVQGNASSSNQRSTRWLYDGSFMRLRNLKVSYSLPSKLIEKAKIKNVTIYMQGQNLLTFTKYDGFDPEFAVDGTAWFTYPISKSVSFGLNVGF